MTSTTDSIPTAPAEAGNCGRSSLALGSADFLRAEAADYEKISTFLGEQADREQIEHVAKLRNIAAEIDTLNHRLRWARENCRVVYYPPDNAYPVEHAPHAKKDMWEALCVAADTSLPNAPDHPRENPQ